MVRWIASVAALGYAGLTQQVAKTGSADPAARDNAVKGPDTAAVPVLGCAYDFAL